MKINLEQQEARQAEMIDQNAKFYETLTPEEQAKLDAIHQAMVILTAAGVGTTAFCWTKHFNSPDEEVPVQYNNWGEIAGLYEEGYGEMTEEQKVIMRKANKDFAGAMWQYIQGATELDMKDKEPWERVVKYFNHFLANDGRAEQD